MSFEVAAEAYDRFMGRYSIPLGPRLAAFAGVARGQRIIDVGCGPGALATELVRLVDAAGVTAVDPSEPFVGAVRERLPGVRVELASAEALAEFLSQQSGMEDVIKTKSDILRFVAELEIAEEEEEEARVS